MNFDSKHWTTAWGRRILFLSIFIVLPLLAVKPVYRYAKYLRADSYWRAARKADARGDWAEVQRLVQLGLMLRPDLPDGYRVYAQLIDSHDPAIVGRSIALWKQVMELGHPKVSDRVAFGLAALREDLPDVAGQQTAILLQDKHPDNEVYNLAGLVAVRFKEIAGAQIWFKKILERDPHDLKATINLARTELLFGKDDAEVRQGIDRLQPLISRKDEWGLESLRLLTEWGVAHPGYFSSIQADFIEKLKSHPKAGIRDQCLAAEWKIKQFPSPEKREKVLDALVAQAPRLPPDEKRQLALWFNHFGWYQKTLSAFPPDPRDPDAQLLVQLDAMAALGRWEELDQFLSQDLFPSQPVLLWLFRARVARELGQTRRFEINWDRALAEGNRNPSSMTFLADYAVKMGEVEKAIEVDELLSQQSGHEVESLLQLVHLYETLGQTRSLLQTIQRLSSFYPKDAAVLNDQAYLGLLLDDPSPHSSEWAREVYALDPHLPAFAATYALSRLKAGKPLEALEAVKEYSPEKWTAPGWQAVYAATLAANGKKAEAVRIAGKIDLKLLKPEEKKLIEGIGK